MGMRVPDVAMAGGISTEDAVYKAIAMGDPFVKAVCMGRTLMIPGMVGKNIGKWITEGNLPKTVSTYGVTPKEIFVYYDAMKERFGQEIDAIPLGAIGLYTYCQKFKTGLQQLMAGSRRFNVGALSRRDLMALTEDASKVSGIPYAMDAHREEAERILQEWWERQW